MFPCWCKCELQFIVILRNHRIIVILISGTSYTLATMRWFGWKIQWHLSLHGDGLDVENEGSSEMLVCQDKIRTACSFFSLWGAGWHETSAGHWAHSTTATHATHQLCRAEHTIHTIHIHIAKALLGDAVVVVVVVDFICLSAQLHLWESRWGR